MPIRDIIKSEEAEYSLRGILDNIHINGPINQLELERLAYLKVFYPNLFKKYEAKLLYYMGLFYKPDLKPTSIMELPYSILAEAIKSKTNQYYTPTQNNALSEILNKKFFSFSAPTSAGKSFLFMDVIKNCTKDVVIVVPSRALIAEYTQKINELFKDNKRILILQFIENINKRHTDRRIFIVTPERAQELFSRVKDFDIELFLFDEAQISEEQIRGLRFDTFVRRAEKLFPNAKKIFAHPFIKNPEAQIYKNKFDIKNNSNEDMFSFKNYKQSTVGKIYMQYETIGDKTIYSYLPTFGSRRTILHTLTRKDIIEEILLKGGTVLIYTSKSSLYKKTYMDLFAKYINMCLSVDNQEAIAIINELKNYIGADSSDKISWLINLMEKGIVIHHGSIPLKCRLLIEQFVNKGYANICFSTSTLTQGINMPFDAVLIENYKFGDDDRQILNLKNLIGRAGRSQANKKEFDYGYVIVKKSSVGSFLKRINQDVSIADKSLLDTSNIDELDEDLHDIFEAILNDSFDDRLQITKTQKERLEKEQITADIESILSALFPKNATLPLTGNEYYKLDNNIRDGLKDSFKKIYLQHLKRQDLTSAEQAVLSASIPIFLWKAQGRSFQQIVALRYFYIADLTKQKELKFLLKNDKITLEEYKKRISKIELNYSPEAAIIPNKKLRTSRLFSKGTTINDLDYDKVVYDTYDYLDKVISLSLINPISSAFLLYFEKTSDSRALTMYNYIKYGTNDSMEILLLRYGFEFEEIDFIKEYIQDISEDEIIFKDSIYTLGIDKLDFVARYIY